MENEIKRLQLYVKELEQLFSTNSIANFEEKLDVLVWSKKEILGHLIDSAINNLQRFTEIQFYDKPYPVRTYNQEALVLANNYQNKDKNDLVQLWLQINNQILFIFQNFPVEFFEFQLLLPNNELSDLKFLITDYIDHLAHHLTQLK